MRKRSHPGQSPQRLPLRVVGVISPWNFPQILSVRAVAPVIVVKDDSEAVAVANDTEYGLQWRGTGPPASVHGVAELVEDEDVRVARLLDAQAKAAELFAEVETRGLIAPGAGERQASDAIRDLAADMFGVGRWWHKRIVRAGPNTLQPYAENPPDRVIGADDIVFCDFGPIFEEWEADFGRTFVLGGDPLKLAIRDALPEIWSAGRECFESHPDITGDELFAHVVGLSREAGWEFGGTIAGHLVGQFPHEKIAGDETGSYIMPGSGEPMRRTDRTGRVCHWILEVHLVDRDRQIGGFHEELLDIAGTTG